MSLDEKLTMQEFLADTKIDSPVADLAKVGIQQVQLQDVGKVVKAYTL